jgi:ABC-type multidrug transport system fused ATPase/permease subunit
MQLKKILSVLSPRERSVLLWQVLADVVVSVLDIIFLAALVWMVSRYTSPGGFAGSWPLLSRQPLLVSIAFLLLFALKNAFAAHMLKLQNRFVFSVAARLSERGLEEYLHGRFGAYVDTDSSVLVRRISQQPVEFAQYVLRGLQQLAGQSLLVLITAAAIMAYDAFLLMTVVLVLLPPALFIGWRWKKKIRDVRVGVRSHSEKTLQHLNEALDGYVESRVFQKEEFFLSRYAGSQRKMNALLAELQVMQSSPPRWIEVFAVAGLFALVLFHELLGDASVPVVTIGVFMAAAYKIMPGLVKILSSIGQMRAYSFTLENLPAGENRQQTSMPAEKIKTVELKNVGFGYDGSFIMRGLNLEVLPGDIVGISGDSGRGKTTLIHLLLGFLHPLEGQILINGKQAVKNTSNPLWQRISYVKQQPFFMHDSIESNVVMGGGGNGEHFSEVMRVSGAGVLLQDGPALLGENGRNVSGGQRQRIAFARALYKECDLLILDEPFSELDEASEREALLYLKELAAAGKMILLITHRPESLALCTKIIRIHED